MKIISKADFKNNIVTYLLFGRWVSQAVREAKVLVLEAFVTFCIDEWGIIEISNFASLTTVVF